MDDKAAELMNRLYTDMKSAVEMKSWSDKARLEEKENFSKEKEVLNTKIAGFQKALVLYDDRIDAFRKVFKELRVVVEETEDFFAKEAKENKMCIPQRWLKDNRTLREILDQID